MRVYLNDWFIERIIRSLRSRYFTVGHVTFCAKPLAFVNRPFLISAARERRQAVLGNSERAIEVHRNMKNSDAFQGSDFDHLQIEFAK